MADGVNAAARHLDWSGSYNVRDLGGLSVAGGTTAWRAVVRGDAPDHLTARGRAALYEYGIRTIVDLRHEEAPLTLTGVTTLRLPLDDGDDGGFWDHWGGGLDCTPLYYRAYLDRFPDRIARVVSAVADAGAGGVLVHCGGGRDRTGLVVLVLLALAGVPAREIAADYALSTERLEPAWRDLGLGDQTGKIAALLARHGTTAEQAATAVVEDLDAENYLRAAGLDDHRLTALRSRLVPRSPQLPVRGWS